MGRRNRLLSITTPEPTPEEKLNHLNNAIQAIKEDDINKLVATIPRGVDIKTVYNFRLVRPCRRVVSFRASLLHVSILNKSMGCTKFLLHLGAPKEASESTLGDRPIHCALRIDCLATLNLLLHYGAQTASFNRRGDSPLHLAAKKGNVYAVKALLEKGADPHVQNRYGETPHFVASIAESSSSIACASILETYHNAERFMPEY